MRRAQGYVSLVELAICTCHSRKPNSVHQMQQHPRISMKTLICLLLTVDALGHTRPVSFCLCLCVQMSFFLGMQMYAGKSNIYLRLENPCFCVLFFGDSTVVHQIGCRSAGQCVSWARCNAFKLNQGLCRSLCACSEQIKRVERKVELCFTLRHGVKQCFWSKS